MEYPSKLIQEAVSQISRLPGIGKKSALRLALHLLKQDEQVTLKLANSLIKLRTETVYCSRCHSISDASICHICSSNRRDKHVLCVVEDSRDVLALENTAQYNGLYFVLGGIISPIHGIGPENLPIEKLLQRCRDESIQEVILALSPTIDGDTTAFYLGKKLQPLGIKITTVARGIPVGNELEYTDEVTLGRSISRRIQFDV